MSFQPIFAFMNVSEHRLSRILRRAQPLALWLLGPLLRPAR